jgi:LL-diaminopimelate aminotransferase
MPLLEKNGFLPDFKSIPAEILKKAKVIYVNYPNNPTGAVAEKSFYADLVKFARTHGLMVVSDVAYSEMSYDGYRPMSLLEIDGARDVCIEFHSLSKTYNMTGWRVGWACGNKRLVAGLAKVKSNIDSGIFSALQLCAVDALKDDHGHIARMNALYQQRRDVLVDGLNGLGWKVSKPKASFYIWAKVPGNSSSIDFAAKVLEQADIVVTPGVGFGSSGEGYVRFALTVAQERLSQAVDRLKKIL